MMFAIVAPPLNRCTISIPFLLSLLSAIQCSQHSGDDILCFSGGPYGAVGVDLAFEAMLCKIFGTDFIETFKAKRPAAWVDLTIAFEARKRTAAPSRTSALNISLPFSFIDFYKRHCGQSVETALRKSKYVCSLWSRM